MFEKIKLTGQNILITLPDTDLKENEAGIMLFGENSADRNYIGEVLAVGKGHLMNTGEWVSTGVNVGDSVCCPKQSVQLLVINKQKYGLVKHQDIIYTTPR